MKLTDQERYEIVNSREKSSALPVAFFHPTNSAPGDPVLEESIRRYTESWEAYRRDQTLEYWEDYPLSDLTFGDLDGQHVWRNIYSGKEMITVTIGESVWSGWVLRPLWDEWKRDFTSPLIYYGDRWCAGDWVLCDELTDDQVQAWEVFRKATAAAKLAYSNSGNPVQITLF